MTAALAEGVEPAASAGLPPLDSVYPITDEARTCFERDGHLALPAVLSPDELSACRDAVRRAVAANLDQHHALEEPVAAARNNWQWVNNLWLQDETVRQLIHAPRLARIAAELLDAERVRLFRDQSYFKGSGGAGTPWHQDGTFIPLDTPKILTMWIALSDMTPESAPMRYASGSHEAGFLGLSAPGDGAMRQFEERLGASGYRFASYDRLRAGDVAVHGRWTMHGTYGNTAPAPREAIVIVYFADGAHVVHDPPPGSPGAPHPHVAGVRANSRAISFPDLPHGARAEGPMAPLLYDRAADPLA
jgi:hypothetical protein